MSPTTQMLQLLKQEADDLDAKLSENRDYKRLQAVRALLAVYEENIEPPIPITGAIVRESITGAIVRGAERLLRERKVRLTSGQIAKALTNGGVFIPGQEKTTRVSSALSSRKKLFDNRTNQGYGLVEWSQKKEAPNNEPGASASHRPGTGAPATSDNHDRPTTPLGG